MLWFNSGQAEVDNVEWLTSLGNSGKAKLRIIVFPYAGGRASAFQEWGSVLPGDVEMMVLSMPELRTRKSLGLDSVPDTIAAAMPELLQATNIPFILVGHSFGAMLAFESARQLYMSHGRVAEKLVLSACKPPLASFSNNIHDLPDSQLVEVLAKLGGIPGALLANRSVLEMFLPVIRHDIKLCETYTIPANTQLTAQAEIWCGAKDPSMKPQSAEAWQRFFSKTIGYEKFAGDHFFIRTEFPRIGRLLQYYASEILQQYEVVYPACVSGVSR